MSLDKSEESRSRQVKKPIKIDGVKAQESTGKGEVEIIIQAISVSYRLSIHQCTMTCGPNPAQRPIL